MKELTLGSLFSGSGGFELAGSIFGIKPIWASEIEPLPIRVTERNFPDCLMLGDINKLHGWAIPKVDIITGGSPCQDMSVAGKRDGLSGERSILFREQIRIIKEMREDDRNAGRTGKEIRCRWMCWENVPGAFSSNQRQDFQSVLTEIIRIAEPQAPPVPIPKDGWAYAGAFMGENRAWSVAYRTLDAKYWGVPQRRFRIFLVADFAGTSAPQILFERKGLSRDFKESRQTWENNHPHPPSSFGETGRERKSIAIDNHPQDSRITIRQDGTAPTLTEKMGTGGNNVPMVMEAMPINDKATRYNGGGDTRHNDGSGNGLGIGKPGDPAPTLTAADRHGVAYCMQGSMIGRTEKNGPQGAGIKIDESFTLNTVDHHAVAYGINRQMFNAGETGKLGFEPQKETSPTIIGKGPNAVMQPMTVPEISGTLTVKMCKGTGGPSGQETQNLVAQFPDYIVRRFTPLECGRLQGFPDWWTEQLGIDNPTDGQIDKWVRIFKTHWEVLTSKEGVKAPKTRKQVIKWLKNPTSDSALYRMWGNGIALPCAMFVLEGIATTAAKESECER